MVADGFKYEGGRSRAKAYKWPLEAGQSNETDSPLEPPEGTQRTDTLTLIQ